MSTKKPQKISLNRAVKKPKLSLKRSSNHLPIDVSQINFTELLKDPITYAEQLTVQQLEVILLIFKDYYYNTDSPLVPDLVYDDMEDVLREREPNSKVLTSVGAAPSVTDRKTKLPYPLASQNKAKFGSGDFDRWFRKWKDDTFVISHKLDGISLMYYRHNGKTKLFTRGTTDEGQDVSHLLPMLDMGHPRPKVPANMKEVAIRGELIMPKETWEEHYGDKYPNVRNWISGQVAQKTPTKEDVGRIRFVTYEIIQPRMIPSEQFKTLDKWGFYTSPYKFESTINENQLLGLLEETTENGEYQIDGLIVSADVDYPISDSNPKHSIAFKSQMGVGANTTVKEVIWQVSKNGLLKPVVLIEPVFLSGANISRASGINAKFIVENEIGAGAEITIVRSGEVIPFITEVINPAPNGADLPISYEYEWTSSGVDFVLTDKAQKEGDAYKAMALRKLLHLTKTLKIEHMGPGTLKKLVDLGYMEGTEILNISYEELYDGANLGANAIKMYNSIQDILMNKGVKLATLMDASGAFKHGIGTRKMQLILDHMPNLIDRFEQIESGNSDETLDDLENEMEHIKGMGSETVPLVFEGLPRFIEFLSLLPAKTKILDWETTTAPDHSLIYPELTGWRLIFTGLRPNDELQAILDASGAKVANSVTKVKDGEEEKQLVIARDPDTNSNKLNKAKEMGVNVVGKEAFLRQFGLQNIRW